LDRDASSACRIMELSQRAQGDRLDASARLDEGASLLRQLKQALLGG
jgi:hypothetical protein